MIHNSTLLNSKSRFYLVDWKGGSIVLKGCVAINRSMRTKNEEITYSVFKTAVLDAFPLGIESGEYLLIVWARDIAGNERANYISLVVK